ncbi:HDIG domain-containing metalloprotein [Eubacterium aggregans]|uniref:HDIG domain-containing metalloprotein n=1 Tax=Eubacterium aggregans TaxID=81409 RepID=UPI0023F40E02|nr:HDIG domain-containing metalloprotein [Eubacterium aggregans]MDD4691505.1 HDIG domain-containing protein [Eubacterium aggregans]
MKDRKYQVEFEGIVWDILNHPKFIGLKSIEHHGNGLQEHCISVAYNSYVIAKKLGLDAESVARGALLHDFFFEDWKAAEKTGKGFGRIKEMHGFKHPKDALRNATIYFNLNEKEEDMILKHMFPLTIVPPMHLESWVVTMVDKGVAIKEMAQEHTPRKLYRKLRAA